MINLAEIIGVEKTVTLAAVDLDAVPQSISGEGYVGDRVDPDELENAWIYDTTVFNSINKSTQVIMAASYELRASKRVRDFYLDFLASIGMVGEDSNFDDLLYGTFQNLMKFGKHFIELVYNKKMTKVVDLLPMNPKTMDYAKDSQMRVVLDRLARPVGYVQTLPYGVSTQGRGDPKPDGVSLLSNQIFLIPERIAHFKLYKYADGLQSIGLIEPAYRSIIRKHKIEEANTNSLYTRGMAPIIDKIGTPEHYPTADMIKTATQNLAKMQHNRYFAVPFWHDISTLEVNQSDAVDTTIKSLKEDIAAAMGMPLALATGSGEATNRSTLATQQKFYEYGLIDIVNRVSSTFKKQIFTRIAKLENFKEVPELVWGDIDAESKDEKAKRLVAYTTQKVGILQPADVKPYVMKSEQLDIYQEKKD